MIPIAGWKNRYKRKTLSEASYTISQSPTQGPLSFSQAWLEQASGQGGKAPNATRAKIAPTTNPVIWKRVYQMMISNVFTQ